jgi:hypothetical protein
MGKTGRPQDIDEWRRREYLDLERRGPHIPVGYIRSWMLTDPPAELPVGYYGSTDIVMGRYNKCVYADYPFGVYDLDVYGDAKYA